MKKVSSMNGGDGETSYANNSFFQKMVMIKTLPIVKDTLKHMLHDQDYYHINSPRKYLKMVDLGCSSGPNAIFTISHVIDTIENLCKEKEYCLAMPEIEVFLNDLPRNDFNNLFKLLANFYKENGEKMAKCFVYGLPGSFYGRLFPNKSLHFAFSCCSLHWLSQVPEGLSNKNKYDIYIAPASPPEVLQVYAKQFEKDFSTFLRLRSQEMISGGHMVLTFLGRSVEDPKSKDDSGYVLSLFSAALADMVAEGLVKADDLSSCNLPMYMPCKQEVEKIIEGGCSFTLDKLHVFRVRCDVTYDEHHHDEDMDDEENYLSSSNKYKNGKVMSDSFRAIMEPMLARHFGLEGSNMDSLFQRYAEKVGEHLSVHPRSSSCFMIAVSMHRR